MTEKSVVKKLGYFFSNGDFDRNIFYVMAITTSVASLAGLIIGPIFNNRLTTYGTAALTAFYIAIILFSYKTKKYAIGNICIVSLTGIGLFSIIFFTTYGINSAFPLYMLLIPAAYGVISKRKRDSFIPIINLNLFLYELRYSFFSKELTEFRIRPYLIGFAVSYALIYWITAYLSIYTRKLTTILMEQSTVDELTEVYNRRSFDEDLKSYPYQIAAMFDIDDFKKVNDTYGHQVGDVVLADFARILKSCSSDEFRVYRWGGEEFVILSKLDAKTSVNLVKKIIDKVRSELCDAEGNQVTVSCGVCQEKKGDLMKTVDECLYEAKTSGKNKVIWNHRQVY